MRPRHARSRCARAALALLALCAAASIGGCAAGAPRPIGTGALAEAQTFPYFEVYWVGPSFAGQPLVATDGQKNYISSIGESVYYGNCVHDKSIVSGSCTLPLQVTTVIYQRHSNSTLGAQRNMVVRGVPATAYEGGRSLEIYSGLVAIDVFSDTPSHALRAASELRPVNAPATTSADLPPPVYCPGLSGPQDASVRLVMSRLPGMACQRASTAVAFAAELSR